MNDVKVDCPFARSSIFYDDEKEVFTYCPYITPEGECDGILGNTEENDAMCISIISKYFEFKTSLRKLLRGEDE